MPKNDNRLKENLKECKVLLKTYGENYWADKIENLDLYDNKMITLNQINNILSWFGGMGSFNDLILLKVNGHKISLSEESKVNKQLFNLRNKIYMLAKEIYEEKVN